jgi:hypothetical protein
MLEVTVRGSGIAAHCCAFLLNKAGVPHRLQETARAKLPAIMLNHSAIALMRDIFERPDLLREVYPIGKRVVAWGPDSTSRTFDHSAVVVSEESLLAGIGGTSNKTGAYKTPLQTDEWLIVASPPLPDRCDEYRFGTQTAAVAQVELASDSDTASCWVESVRDGWLFLIEDGPRTGWLLAVGDLPDRLLRQSSITKMRIAHCHESGHRFLTYPRIAFPLYGSNWIACGNAAIGFDPICGDGTAYALREGLLTAAVLRAGMKDSTQFQDLLAHYQARLLAGFRKHLALCLDFYTRGGESAWWKQQCDELRKGLEWCDAKLKGHSGFRYRLDGFELLRCSDSEIRTSQMASGER